MIIILVAVKDELEKKDLPKFQVEYTGVGKVNAAYRTIEIINEFSPSLIINFGTAGALRKEINGLVEVTRFFQRDMDATPLGFELGQTPFENIDEISISKEGLSCGTGDTFVTERPKLVTDLVDMEAYAVAKVCAIKNVAFRCFKFVSDNANTDADQDWVKNVAKGKELFKEKMKVLGEKD